MALIVVVPRLRVPAIETEMEPELSATVATAPPNTTLPKVIFEAVEVTDQLLAFR